MAEDHHGWQERDRPLTYHFDARGAVEPPADFDGRRAAIWRSIVAELVLAHYANPDG
jgi:hypothetical protein